MDLDRIKQLNLQLLFATRGGRSEVARLLGYQDTNYINQMATGHSPIGTRTEAKLRKTFRLSPTWMVTAHPAEWLERVPGIESEVSSMIGDNVADSSQPQYRDGRIPEISWVAATDWTDSSDPYEPGVALDWHSSTKPHSESTYALKVTGDSMVNSKNVPPTYFPGQVIIVDPEQAGDCSSGDRVIALLDDETAPHDHKVTFKQLVFDDGHPILRPLNTDGTYRTIREPFRVIGKVINVVGE